MQPAAAATYLGQKKWGFEPASLPICISLANQDFRTDLDSQPGGRRTYKMIYRLASGL